MKEFPYTNRVTIASFIGGPQDGHTMSVRPEITEVHFRLNVTNAPYPPGDAAIYIYRRTGPTQFRYHHQTRSKS